MNEMSVKQKQNTKSKRISVCSASAFVECRWDGQISLGREIEGGAYGNR